ncbi:hypothetical protein FRC08_001395 [Ceratobasidium sp. 394]|nr:hypothetical protein FRC08_001395 [Ceratobasidium sp. 394]
MSVVCNLYKETFPGQPRWSIDEIPDLTDQVIIVTGGNAGIGRETCKVLLKRGANVYLAARSKSKADEAIEWLQAKTGGKTPVFLQLDLADLVSVRRAAEEFQRQEQKLDVLFNNGGVMAPPIEMKTSTGYDIQFGTNVLGHYLFTILLLPVLIHTARTSLRGHVRVVNFASSTHWLAPKGGIDYSTLVPNDHESEARRVEMGTGRLYAQSKWGNVGFAKELARRYEPQGIVSTSLHPGAITTELQRYSTSGIGKALSSPIFWPAPYGALTQLYAGTAPEGDKFSGQYLTPWARLSKSRTDTHDEEAGRKLWAWLEEQVKLN